MEIIDLALKNSHNKIVKRSAFEFFLTRPADELRNFDKKAKSQEWQVTRRTVYQWLEEFESLKGLDNR